MVFNLNESYGGSRMDSQSTHWAEFKAILIALANIPLDETVILLLTFGLWPMACLFGLPFGKLQTVRLKTLLFESENYGNESQLLIEPCG